MKHPLTQLSLITASFFGLWLLLAQINWVELFQIKKATSNTEKAIGDLYIDMITSSEEVVYGDSLTGPIMSIIDQIKKANNLDLEIKLHIIKKDMVNAIAIPDDNMLLFSGLIQECTSSEELAGVLGHEIAHMQKNHVMKKLVKEVGLSVLLSMATGGSDSMIKETFRALTSLAYDRNLESEADLTSVTYLKNAEIDPKPFADLLYRFSLLSNDSGQVLELMQSHPASEQRAKDVLDDIGDDYTTYRPLMSEKDWSLLKDKFDNL